MKNHGLWQFHYLIYVAIALSCYAYPAGASDNKAQQPTDFIELAAVMLKDGHHDRALLALQSVDLGNKKNRSGPIFNTLQGLSYLGFERPRSSQRQLAASSQEWTKGSIHLYLFGASLLRSERLQEYP